jgi:alanine-glyoxylate transaminase / serine-glyoxylate transaminase / serine-pyruvate transaminase
VKEALSKKTYRFVAITHVDTSTGVLTPVQSLAKAIREVSPEILIAVDGVCSIGGEELRMTEWDIDFALTGSQKALSVPPGLSVSVARPRALAAAQNRKTPVPNYYCQWSRWIPIMKVL